MGEDKGMGTLEVFIDGACEPINPGGTASYGLVIKSGTETLLKKSGIVGSGKEMSNNVAEYSGLISFLEWYHKNNRNDQVIVYSDSQLLINQMNRTWTVKGGLYKPYRDKALSLLTQEISQRIRYKWISKEENYEADKLSKEALASLRNL